MKSLETVIQEMARYYSPYQRVVVWVDGFDHYFDTTIDGAYVAIGDMSKLMVTSVNGVDAPERGIPITINCKSPELV